MEKFGSIKLIQITAPEEIRCPLISDRVSCYNCGSPNFNIDGSAQRKTGGTSYKVPGSCDDCGYRFGMLVKPIV